MVNRQECRLEHSKVLKKNFKNLQNSSHLLNKKNERKLGLSRVFFSSFLKVRDVRHVDILHIKSTVCPVGVAYRQYSRNDIRIYLVQIPADRHAMALSAVRT